MRPEVDTDRKGIRFSRTESDQLKETESQVHWTKVSLAIIQWRKSATRETRARVTIDQESQGETDQHYCLKYTINGT